MQQLFNSGLYAVIYKSRTNLILHCMREIIAISSQF